MTAESSLMRRLPFDAHSSDMRWPSGKRLAKVCVFAEALGLAQRSEAAAPATNSSVTLTISRPVSIAKMTDMDFGSLLAGSGGSALLNPNTDALSVSGGVAAAGGSAHAARFRITAARLALVLIHAPSANIILMRSGGSDTMKLDNWTMSGLPLRLVNAGAPTDFSIGGTLHVAPDQAAGTYVGSFEVTIDFF